MREIKFRGKRVDNGGWVYGYFLYGAVLDEHVIWTDHDYWIVVPESVGQYTGLKDRNGKEIYEGDIFQAGSYPLTKEDDYVGVVEYDHDRFWGVRRVKAGSDVRGISDGMADGLWEFIDESTEVIGNIYEQPHLLNQE
ncbi:YopX family protein [Brevibacillus halotolerans]|nr:YopX family protein [Brevibacillus halotolerans]